MINNSEQYVFDVCQKSFLSLWSYPNPRGKKGKELCDVLVVCGTDVIIISVKDIEPTDSGDVIVDWNRWTKNAIDSSAKQIYGAERWLESVSRIIQNDDSPGLSFPPVEQRRVHRIAVAFGGQDKVPLYYGDFGKGFVHALDEKSFDILLSELDTITDFVRYLRDKEEYFNSGGAVVFDGYEEDLLAFYLHRGRTFPDQMYLLLIDDNLWETFVQKDEYKAKKREDRVSYLWDEMIETYILGITKGWATRSPSLLEVEPAIREMALASRYQRRFLSKATLEFLELVKARKVRSRIVHSVEQNMVYVLLGSPNDDPDARIAELGARCWVARDRMQECDTVVGIALYSLEANTPLDLLYLHKPDWTEDDLKRAEIARQELGFFQNPVEKHVREDEYPAS